MTTQSQRDEWFERSEEYLRAEEAAGGRGFTDEAKRACDIINGHLVAQPDAVQKWVAIRLSDGGSDGVLYDTKAHAVDHQLDEYWCFYVCIPPTGFTPPQTQVMIDMHRAMYDNGMRMVDPGSATGGPQWIPPVQRESLAQQARQLGILRKSARWNNG